ncbi:hypothetical protein [Roseicyclus amphidinii]|uniref:hypothetical protein n=1 Tax=Roseicyclus amphidinii TaxID=3034232 RepID=UPI0024E1661D|nr:hypothetical protein [Roseicyclus sp. Amp-Y-6]
MRLDRREAIRRRVESASAYLRAGQCLRTKLEDFGPSGTVLDILAFEILLKALVLAEGKEPKFSHDYYEGWLKLDTETRARLIKYASVRFAGHSDFSDPEKLMTAWNEAFTKYRYDYEVNETRSIDEIKRVSQQWFSEELKNQRWDSEAWDNERSKKSNETADFAFYPLELRGLAEAIQAELKVHVSD